MTRSTRKLRLDLFNDDFWVKYREKKYKQIVENIPTLLEFKWKPEEIDMFQKLCIFSIVSMRLSKIADEKCLSEICFEYKKVIANAEHATKAMEYFICIEYVCELSSELWTKALNMSMVEEMVTTVLNKPHTSAHWVENDLKICKRFIVVLAQVESLLNEKSPKFAMTEKALDFIRSGKFRQCSEKSDCWLSYVSDALRLCTQPNDASVSKDMLMKVRDLVKAKNDLKKDIAIMTSQVMTTCTRLLSYSPLTITQDIIDILGLTYEIIRQKSIPSSKHIVERTYSGECCEKMDIHYGLGAFSGIRELLVRAIDCNKFDEVLVSKCSNFMVAESEALKSNICKNRSRFVPEFESAVISITNNIERIIATCGRDRGVRTLEKFVSMAVLSSYANKIVSAALVKAYDRMMDCNGKLIPLLVFNIIAHNYTNKARGIYDMHVKQNNDPKKFEAISLIVKKVPKTLILPPFDPVKLQLDQLNVEIEYPILNQTCVSKLIKDVCEMDFYKNDQSCYVTLIKSGICYLKSALYIRQYKSNVTFKDYFQPLDEKYASLSSELEIVKSLRESLEHLSTFLKDKSVWLQQKDSNAYALSVEKLLQKIGECLIDRHYKDLAIKAFDLLYQMTKLLKHPMKQIVAAGYLAENISLSEISEKEIVTELQSIVMQKLKDVNTMSDTELGNFMLSFLQLTIYTMRCQYNIVHAKKYLQAIIKLLNKHDSKKEKYLVARLKYSEAMLEMILRDSETTITPITFIEDIYHRFVTIKSHSTRDVVSGIIFDLINTIYEFTQPRYEFRFASSLLWTVHRSALSNGYLFLLAKIKILETSECLRVSGKRLPDHLSYLDVLFECKISAVPKEAELPTVTWNREISPLIHLDNCECCRCTNKFLSQLTMEAAAVKAWAVYYDKDLAKSLQSYERIHEHWTATNALSYATMLMNYSNCLISNCLEEQSTDILSEALDACNDYAQAQDISQRLLSNNAKDKIQMSDGRPSYANESRKKPSMDNSKKKLSSKQALRDDSNKQSEKYNKKSNIRF